ncbi:BREX-1 system phosphatase PglZ type A [Peribacillus frigoritolerans]|uniref:BREX-1 system phosphatase PglZ type A n=1 Tax=Peribacillus frigoritolerans TaxID=450367 RepID=UPI0021AA3B70|nr:BREX-1 system phosphatase PglZ type A [Peribacillus frigoritolerans]MCT4479106.1 BREX-1 system phosphatase PglZ type A [Peribacillus frigoritolerans]
MLDLNIIQELLTLFHQQREHNKGSNRALVFWYDLQGRKRDLEEIESALSAEGIGVWMITPDNVFRTKIKFELEDTESSYLLYAPFEKPENKDNFLLDMLLYGGKYGEFIADELAIKMQELRLDHLAIRPFMKEHWSFFGSQKRVDRFKRLLPNAATEDDVKSTMIAVLTGADSIYPPELLRNVVKNGDIQQDNEVLKDIEKYISSEMFYEIVEEYFGIQPVEENRLFHIIQCIIFQHFKMYVEDKYLESFAFHSTVPNICKVFVDEWLLSKDKESVANILILLEEKWDIKGLLQKYSYEPFIQCETFLVIEEKIVYTMYNLLLEDALPIKEWRSILHERSRGYWYYARFENLYMFLEQALYVYEWKEAFSKSKEPQNGDEWFSLYTEQQYMVDYRYRQLNKSFSILHDQESVIELYQKLTYWYEHEFLRSWGRYTDTVVNRELSQSWNIQGVLHQQDFFKKMISPVVEGSRERIFVIISDALRYEVGHELKESFASRLNAEVALIPMQGVLPSYTQLGMAALLPGNITAISENGTVEVEGLSTLGTTNRTRVLQRKVPESVAFNLEDFIALNKEEGMQHIRGKRVVYLYHNYIDALGDDIKTEKHTYESVERTIEQMKKSVKKLVGTYEAVRIYMTSDHGFLYQSGKVEAYQKTERIDGEIFDRNRRFAIGKNLSLPEGTTRISLGYLGLEVDAVIAKGLNRFTAQGGQRFVHGGAMPQECLVPLIEYRQIRGKAKKSGEQRVNVRVASVTNNITSYHLTIPFFQEEKAENDYLPRSLRMAFYFKGERISNEVLITFDSMGDAKEREMSGTFHFFEGRYKTGDRCVLRIEDVSGSTTYLYDEEEFLLKLYSV